MKYAKKFLTRGLAAGVVCAVVAGNVQAADLKVGLSVSLSGPNSSLGVPYSKGMQAALAYKGQTGGHKIQLVVLDDASDPTVAGRNARKLAEEGLGPDLRIRVSSADL